MIDGVNGTNPAAAAQANAGLSQLGSDAFLKLLVAQLRYQNPLQPTDPSSMLGQTAQFTTVETLQAISDMQRELMGLQQALGAMGMIEKHVKAIDSAGQLVEGIVEKVAFGEDGAILTVDGKPVPLDSVIEATSGTSGD